MIETTTEQGNTRIKGENGNTAAAFIDGEHLVCFGFVDEQGEFRASWAKQGKRYASHANAVKAARAWVAEHEPA